MVTRVLWLRGVPVMMASVMFHCEGVSVEPVMVGGGLHTVF